MILFEDLCNFSDKYVEVINRLRDILEPFKDQLRDEDRSFSRKRDHRISFENVRRAVGLY